ncbi:MAG: 3-oxoacyl-ACP reductase FabG [Verrucomicrobiales bacterium]|nr:3-oxoacyl-ACP reductase FabG [Verrucomicrobiales bacterium]
MNSQPLVGRVAIITGASKGFGREIALALSRAGASVALIARSADALAAVASTIQSEGGTAIFRVGDITHESDVEALAADVQARFGGADILINNAGINIRKEITEFSLAEWNQVLNTNLTGAFLMCRAVVPLLKGRGYGRILNLTSIMSHAGLPGRTAYAASKAGLLGLTKALALELAPLGITVNGISPGPFATEMNQPLLNNPELNRQFLTRIPLGRWGEPSDIGALVVHLCRPEAGFMTGTDLVVDGGWLAQ